MQAKLTEPWHASPFTGLLHAAGPVPRRAHDPEVIVWAGTVPGWGRHGEPLAVGGAGWDAAGAEAATVGEAVERWQSRRLAQDHVVTASFRDWPLAEPAVAPDRLVLFHPEQYAQAGFLFVPFTPATPCRWICCREATTGNPWWVPADLVFLDPVQGGADRLAPAISTGLSCGKQGQSPVLRGLQEVIERDALMGAWWGRYPLEEHEPAEVFTQIGDSKAARLIRPNLHYRCFRIASPFADHVTLVTLAGTDHEGFCFSVGSACREDHAASWQKSFLEAVQGRHYVRHLKSQLDATASAPSVPRDFAEHAVYYSLWPEELARTVLQRASRRFCSQAAGPAESLDSLRERLGPERPILVRLLTPPALSSAGLDLVVVRVLVPGLQPLHGHHQFPFLGGPLWSPRGLAEWRDLPPHPFP